MIRDQSTKTLAQPWMGGNTGACWSLINSRIRVENISMYSSMKILNAINVPRPSIVYLTRNNCTYRNENLGHLHVTHLLPG
jgi:hypothetical protein